MHIVIDIRDSHPLGSFTERYGESWGALWKQYHPHDTLSYLIWDTQVAKTKHYIQVPQSIGTWWMRKKLIGTRGNEVFRCVNFSLFEPYDPQTPTLSHIFHNRSWLYPSEGEERFIAKKALEYRMSRIVNQSHKIIVPSMSTGLECVELWGVKESHVEIIPYIPLQKNDQDALTGTQFHIGNPFFLYDGSFGAEANILEMLKGFESYKRNSGKEELLVLHGSPGQELSHITHMIRTFELTENVKLLGVLDTPQYEWLYAHAKAWIMLGSYYSGGPRIELAHTYQLPMILSDKPSIREYEGTYIHSNHILSDLPRALINLDNSVHLGRKNHEYSGEDIVRAYELHLSEGKRK